MIPNPANHWIRGFSWWEADAHTDYETRFHELRGPLATKSAAARWARALHARRLADDLFALADEMVARNPLVVV